MNQDPTPGDVLLLEREIASLPYETGLFVLCSLTLATAEVALVSADEKGLYAIDNRYTMSRGLCSLYSHRRVGETNKIRAHFQV